ncbi:MAG: radical SAM protein [Firmicutes bacterium]|nr:radical SAM protein [Bacillota bacterium]
MMKPITQVRCLIPFTLLGVHPQGEWYSCCPLWSKLGSAGKWSDKPNALMDIWNSEIMQQIRRAVLDDELEKVCNFEYCLYAMLSEYRDLEAQKNDDPNFNHTIDQIIAGKTILDTPPNVFHVSNSGRCNLNCVMCEAKTLKEDDLFNEKLFTRIIPSILPTLSRISLQGYGEALFNPHSRRFLQTLDASRYPHLKIQLFTNGLLFGPKLWETIKHNCFEYVSVSIDAASKETYEKIRRNGNWDILRKNLEFISELKRQNVFNFAINFIVMKSNYREMKDFAELGLRLGCDRICFQKIWGTTDVRENINFTHNRKIFAEVGEILADPIFSRPEVDTTQIDEYRKYQGKSASFRDALITKAKESLYYFPIKPALR